MSVGPTSDRDLLQQYARTRDSAAFSELVRRYANLVYATARRITRSPADAEDVAQSCFLALARQAASIHTSLPGWLHGTATRSAAYMIRQQATRERHEKLAAELKPDPSPWTAVEPQIDRAVEDLPDDLRQVIVQHYFAGISQSEIALHEGVNQSTISRRLGAATDQLRVRLEEAGLAVSAPAIPFTDWLGQLGAERAPADLPVNLTTALSTAASATRFTVIAKAAAALFIITGAATLAYWVHPKAKEPTMTILALPPRLNIRLQGFGMVRDSVSVSLQAAARQLGKDADYDHLYALSGNAFAPAINTAETCRSWWHVQARMGTHNLPAMAASVGLSAQRLPVPTLPDKPTDEQSAAVRRAAADLVVRAMNSGALVITEGGWDEVGGWVWSGVITDVSSDGTLRGTALSAATGDGKENVVWKYPGALWTIQLAGATSPRQDTDHLMLKSAVDRIRGTGEYAKQGTDYYGLPAMDMWLDSMRDIRGFCPGCFKNSPVAGVQDAPDNDKRMYEAALVVSRVLHGDLASYPPAAKQWLNQAANCYDRISQLLAPAATGKGFSYDSLSSLDAQRRYAADVLLPVRTELEWAAVYLERAVAVADGANLLDNVFAAYDPANRANTDMNATRTNLFMRDICMQSMGTSNVGYDMLMVLSGDATTFAYHPRKYFIMYSPPDDPKATEQRIVAGSGFGWEYLPKATSTQELWGMICQTIDSGRPLQAAWLDDFIIAGYQDAPNPSDRKVYAMGKWALAGWLSWSDLEEWRNGFGTLSRPTGQPVTREDLTPVLLERIVSVARQDGRATVAFMKEGRFSFDGMEAYAADIADPSKTPGHFDGGWLACHCVNRQWSGRICASRFLAAAAKGQPPKVASHLQSAANLYERSYQLWQQFRTTLTPDPGGDQKTRLQDKWSNMTARQLGAELLRQAITVEKQAVTEIEAAMAAQ